MLTVVVLESGGHPNISDYLRLEVSDDTIHGGRVISACHMSGYFWFKALSLHDKICIRDYNLTYPI